MLPGSKIIYAEKKYCTVFLLLAMIMFLNACNNKKDKSEDGAPPTIENLYLGQQPPGLMPEPFAPDIVSTAHYEYSSTFSPDLKEFYFIREGGNYEEASLVVFKNINNEWQESLVSEWIGQPVISPDGMTMHLGKRYMERTKTGWSEVKELEAPFNDMRIMRLSASANGTYYFDTYDENKPDFPIRYSRLVNGKHELPQEVGKTINTGIKNFNHPFIAPDESYIMWDAVKEEGHGSSDIYVSFKQQDGSWGNAINLGDKVNTTAWEASASITPDGKYLFFSRNMGSDNYENVDIFWVDAQVIEHLRPKE